MLGTILNIAGILLGGIAGLYWPRPMPPEYQSRLKMFLAAAAVWVGFSMLWRAVNGSFRQVLGQLGILLLALILGPLVGRLLRLQKNFSRLGGFAENELSRPVGGGMSAMHGFVACAVIFCLNPLGITGAIQDGLGEGKYQTLALKAALDGLAALGLATVLGWRVLLAALPLAAFQGTLALGARFIAPQLSAAMMDSIHAAAALVVLSAVVLILGIRKVPLADYLPCLAVAPLLTWWWR
ncbi:MAG: DUF554 family protein [Verrucomicrobia bacterium]|nr:DUF554 family protein [Verrucomicrobiota bacterium]